jgi:DNA-binding transcriptional LysR family regulator
MLKPLTLNQLKVFLTALELGNLTSAASELDMSQSALSHALAEIEKSLGAKLLERGRFGVRPTPLGKRVAPHVRQLFQAEAAIRQEVSIEQGQSLPSAVPPLIFYLTLLPNFKVNIQILVLKS